MSATKNYKTEKYDEGSQVSHCGDLISGEGDLNDEEEACIQRLEGTKRVFQEQA